MHANKREEIKEVRRRHRRDRGPERTTGDTLCERSPPVVLEIDGLPGAGHPVAIEPKTKADQEKMGVAIAKLLEEDPTLHLHTDPETGQTIISGMGELHLEIIVGRLAREFGVRASVRKPQVAYREGRTKCPGRREK